MSRTQFSFIPWALVAILATAPLTIAADTTDAAGAVADKPCPRCEGKGRLLCPRCKGSGNLRKPCPTCRGLGRKPCPGCSAPIPSTGIGRAASPGRIPCPACSGKGVIEATGRPCFKCQGTREQVCPVCLGKGDQTCPKTRFDRTCPTCGYAGTVACSACRGTGRRSAGALDVPARAEADEDAGESEEAAEEAAAPRRGERRDAASEGRERLAAARVAALSQWEDLSKQYEELQGLATAGLGEKIRRAKSELSRLQRRAAEEAGGKRRGIEELARKLREASKEAADLDRIEDRVSEEHETLEKNYRRARPLSEAAQQAVKADADDDVDVLQDRLDLFQRILERAQRSVASIRAEKPEELAKKVKVLEARTETLRADVEKAIKEPPPAPARRVDAGAEDEPEELVDSNENASNGARSNGKGSSGAKVAASARTTGQRAAATRTKPSQDTLEESSDSGDSEAPALATHTGQTVAVVLGFVAVGVCSLVFYVLHRRP